MYTIHTLVIYRQILKKCTIYILQINGISTFYCSYFKCICLRLHKVHKLNTSIFGLTCNIIYLKVVVTMCIQTQMLTLIFLSPFETGKMF